MSTKDFSDKQESSIAKYLGWSQVTGSGARNFHPGDIISPQWLGECKTHVEHKDYVTFMFDHWDKIAEEAKSQFKRPVLFTDDGTQRISKTYAMFEFFELNYDDVDKIVDHKSYSFKPEVSKQKMSHIRFIGHNGQVYAIAPLNVFKEYDELVRNQC